MNASPPIGLDSRTALRVSEITDIVLTHLPGSVGVRSIVLSGGFALGESGHYLVGERPIPFGDYDVDVVVDRILLDSEIGSVSEALETQLGFRSVTRDSGPTLVEDPKVFNVLDLRFKTVDEFLNRPPDLALFDFLETRRIIHGEDLAERIPPLPIREVSPFSPWRILGNRITLLMNHMNLDFQDRPPTLHEGMAFQLAVCRVYADLAGMLAFLYGGYRTSPNGRVQFLETLAAGWRNWVPDAEGFLRRIQTAVHFKKEPRLERLTASDLFREWFTVVEDLGRILPHAANLLLVTRRVPLEALKTPLLRTDAGSGVVVNNPFDEDWRGMVARQIREYPGLYFRDFVLAHLKRSGRRLPQRKFLASQVSRCYGTAEHLAWRGTKWTLKNLRRSTLAPTAFQSAVQPLVLFSLRPDLTVDLQAVELFEELMDPYMLLPFAFLEPARRWEANKRCFVHEMLDYRKRT